jgi:uncharacterized phage-associated protein
LPYLALTIARYFIEISNGGKTPLQVNKMVYIAHGWNLAIFNDSLIIEQIEAWEYGPIIPILYHEFKRYGNDPIPNIPVEETKHIKDDTKHLLDKVITVYGNYSSLQLSSLTHQKGTPWERVYCPSKKLIIPNDIIKTYYIEKAKKL